MRGAAWRNLQALLGSTMLLACAGGTRLAELVGADGYPRPEGAPKARRDATPLAPVASGSLFGGRAEATYTVILPAGTDASAALAAAEDELKAAQVPVAEPGAKPARIEALVVAESGFSVTLMETFGVELAEADKAGLRAATDTLRIAFPGRWTAPMDAEHAAAALALSLATQNGGWIVDFWTGQTMTAVAFAAKRPADGPAEVKRLTMVHEVAEDGDGDGMFLDTAGLARFGLPELVIHNVPKTYATAICAVVNAAGQTLVENGGLATDGVLDVRWAALRTQPWPELLPGVIEAGGSGEIQLAARWAPVGDAPLGSKIELLLPGSGTAGARTYDAIRFVEPSENGSLGHSPNDAELIAARDRARAKLKDLAPHFSGGVPELERLIVKAPFTTLDGQVEWMWVEVASWNGDKLAGTLLNDPFGTMAVRAGDHVTVRQDELFDYEWSRADGTTDGNETTAILLRREGE